MVWPKTGAETKQSPRGGAPRKFFVRRAGRPSASTAGRGAAAAFSAADAAREAGHRPTPPVFRGGGRCGFSPKAGAGAVTPPDRTFNRQRRPSGLDRRTSLVPGRAAPPSLPRTTQGGGFCPSARAMIPFPRQRHSAGVFRRSATVAPPFPRPCSSARVFFPGAGLASFRGVASSGFRGGRRPSVGKTTPGGIIPTRPDHDPRSPIHETGRGFSPGGGGFRFSRGRQPGPLSLRPGQRRSPAAVSIHPAGRRGRAAGSCRRVAVDSFPP